MNSQRQTLRRALPITILSMIAAVVNAEDPIAQIAVISNPYITTLDPQEIKDENGSVRDFLAKAGPESMVRMAALVKQIKPDALVVLGSLTWSGSESDLNAFAEQLSPIEVPTLVVPGHRDEIGWLS